MITTILCIAISVAENKLDEHLKKCFLAEFNKNGFVFRNLDELYEVRVFDIKGDRLVEPTIIMKAKDGSIKWVMHAPEAIVRGNAAGNQVLLSMKQIVFYFDDMAGIEAERIRVLPYQVPVKKGKKP